MDELNSLLESGFDEAGPQLRPPDRSYTPSPLNRQMQAPRPIRLNDSSSYQPFLNGHIRNGAGGADRSYSPDEPLPPDSGNSVSSSVENRAGYGHAKKRSGGAGRDRYGPLGPLADDDTGWGSRAPGGGSNGRYR